MVEIGLVTCDLVSGGHVSCHQTQWSCHVIHTCLNLYQGHLFTSILSLLTLQTRVLITRVARGHVVLVTISPRMWGWFQSLIWTLYVWISDWSLVELVWCRVTSDHVCQVVTRWSSHNKRFLPITWLNYREEIWDLRYDLLQLVINMYIWIKSKCIKLYVFMFCKVVKWR